MSIRGGLCIAALTAATSLAQPALADDNVKVGALRCNVAAGLGMIVTSSKEMTCIFTSSKGYSERYFGAIRKFGLALGSTNKGTLAWDVFAPTLGPKRHALAGEYLGVGASATVGAGLGANALVGGDSRSFTLQPLSIQTQTGLDLAAGVSSMSLRPGA